MKTTLIICLLSVASIMSCSVIQKSDNQRPRYDNLWLLDQDKYIPDDSTMKLTLIAYFEKGVFDRVSVSLSEDFDTFIPDLYCISMEDSLLFGLFCTFFNYKTKISRQGIVLIDTSSRLIRSSNTYELLRGPFTYKNKQFYETPQLAAESMDGNMSFKQLFITRDSDIRDMISYKNSYLELTEQLIKHKFVTHLSMVLPGYCYFTEEKSYAYDTNGKCLYTYNLQSKEVTKFSLSADDPILNKTIFSFNSHMQFVGVLGHYIVYKADPGYYTTALYDMQSNKFYTFLSTTISDRMNITNVVSFKYGYSGYQMILLNDKLYYTVRTENGDVYLIQLELLK
jgi:uncharacterized membrane protein